MNSDIDKKDTDKILEDELLVKTRRPSKTIKPTEMDEPSTPGGRTRPRSDPPAEFKPIPGYTIEEKLPARSGSLVYKARNDEGKLVVVKQFPEESYRKEKKIQSIINDGLEHHGLLLAEHFIDEYNTMVLPYLRGGDLWQLLKYSSKKIITPKQTWVIVLDLLNGLQSLHERGIVHYDVKSKNVLIDINNPKLEKITAEDLTSYLDYNLKLCDYEFSTHRDIPNNAGFIIGTPLYIAPEVILGDRVDPRIDIYGAGIILYRLLAGRYPFIGENDAEVKLHHLESSPPDITLFNQYITSGQKKVLEKALAKKPEDRYQSALEFKCDWLEELTKDGLPR